MTGAAAWRARPVFLTSTFRDMHAERDWLRTRVFPELAERLRARFHHLEVVDLRWGVDSSSVAGERERERLVLTVCLREIERSRPFLVGLLGDRYGWAPPADRIGDAANEAGLDGNLAGTSVTELEILHGVLHRPDQQRRSWFYLRDPLPYHTMPPDVAARYSDAHGGAADAADRVRRLETLKTRLREALPGRVRSYRGEWDAVTGQLVGLERWGAQVLADLWSDLERETDEMVARTPRTWQEQDRQAFEAFVEGRVRGFVGRSAVTRDLLAFATTSGTDGGPWATCVTAEPGGGKSSLLGHVYRELRQRPDVLVLAHAAGISVRSTEVDRMLSRWVSELAEALGESDPLPDGASSAEVTTSFGRWLRRAAGARRVVVLVDALDQFGSTIPATYLTWLPAPWPADARLIAAAIPGAQSRALLERPGTFETRLPPIDREEAAALIRQLCGRYHRTVNPRVEDALLDAHRDDGAPAWGNPLWLELAVEEINLLGADAFERADAAFPDVADPGERIVRLLLSVVTGLPGEVAALYAWIMDGTARRFGEAWTDALLGLLAVSRAGWRESDLEVLVPRRSGEAWDPLRFAAVRRAFRAHLVQRGAHAQWDMAHAQMRAAARARLNGREGAATVLHALVADYLLALDRDDPLHETETMVHLLQGGDVRRAAVWYGSGLTTAEAIGATETLRDLALGGGRALVCSLLDQPIDLQERGVVAEQILYVLDEMLRPSAPVGVRETILHAVARTFGELGAADPASDRWPRALAVCRTAIGDVRTTQGDLAGALSAYRTACDVTARLVAADPGDPVKQRDLGVSRGRIGNIERLRGDLAGALATFRAVLEIDERLAAADPDDGELQHALAIGRSKVADVLADLGDLSGALAAYRTARAAFERAVAGEPGNVEWQGHGASCLSRIAHMRLALGDLPGARTDYQAAIDIHERLAAADPRNGDLQETLANGYSDLGDVWSAQGDLRRALAAHRAALVIRERLAAADPADAGRQDGLAVSHDRVGGVLHAQGDLSGALAAYEAAQGIAARLAAIDPANGRWQSHLAVTHDAIGGLRRAQGDLAGALASYEAGLAVRQRLVEADPPRAPWQRDLSISQMHIGTVHEALGDPGRAEAAFYAALGVRERLAEDAPDHPQAQRDLASAHLHIGALQRARGDMTGALVSCRAARDLLAGLVAADPTNAAWAHDLAISETRTGDVHAAREEWAQALAAYQAAVGIAERLAVADPTNVDRRHALVIGLDRIGEARQAQGDQAGALAARRAALDVAERVLAANPTSADWQHSVASSHARIGDLLRAQGDPAGAHAAYRAALVVRQRLVALDPGNAGWQLDLAVLLQSLARLCAEVEAPEAGDYWRQCHVVLQRMRARGLFIDPPLIELLEVLDAAAPPETAARAAVDRAADVATEPGPRLQTAAGVSRPHPGADADRAARLNVAYQAALAAWKALPWWKRLRTTPPEPPRGI